MLKRDYRTCGGFALGLGLAVLPGSRAFALQYYDFTGTPGATVTLAETAPNSGTYNFRDDYVWNTNIATLEADGATLGPWAASTFDYSVYQNTGVRNTLDLEGQFDFVIYHFAVPIPNGRQLDNITVEASLNRGVHARARANDAQGWADQPALLIPTASLEPPLSASVPAVSIDQLSTPGMASFQLKFEQESGNFGYLDFLNITASLVPIAPQWVGQSGDWHSAYNWTGGIPNGVDSTASFLSLSTSPQTVFTNIATTVGTMVFDNANTFVVAGVGSLTMDSSSGTAHINVVQGSHKLNLPLYLNDNTIANVAAGGTLTIADPLTLVGGSTLTKTGDGTMNIISTVENVAAASLVVTAGAVNAALDLGNSMSVASTGGTTSLKASQHIASLDVSGGNVIVGPAANVVVNTKSLSATGSGQVDLRNSRIIVDYTGSSELASVASAVSSGRLTSSLLTADTVIAFGEASDLYGSFPAVFAGEIVDSSAVLIAHTVVADASLDGTVSSTDFNQLAAHYGQTTGSRWTQGDFDGNGKINTLDFNLLAGHFGQSLPSGAALGAVVPEPATLSVAVFTGLMVGRRSRKSLR
jgi:hypothetical protein